MLSHGKLKNGSLAQGWKYSIIYIMVMCSLELISTIKFGICDIQPEIL